MCKTILRGEMRSALKVLLYLAVFMKLISMVDACASRTFLEAQYRLTAWESSKIVLNNPPKCGDPTSASLDDRDVILNQIQTSFDARWSLADFCGIHRDSTGRAKKKQIVNTWNFNSKKRNNHCSAELKRYLWSYCSSIADWLKVTRT